jgi:uncharacterized membrane protein (UPF0127 family)
MHKNIKKLYVEVASTSDKHTYGLMNRKHMGDNEGMLFKFSRPSIQSFWMLNTYIPLDIAFLEDDGKIFQIEQMSPLSLKSVCSKKPCRYVLEVNRGWFKKNNIDKGMVVSGLGIKKIAQNQLPQRPQQNPNVVLEKTIREKLEDANLRGKNLIIIYQTKGGLNLPPKSISPPFEFEDNAEGDKDAVVKVWDNQTAGWKSFLVDNIISLEYDEK